MSDVILDLSLFAWFGLPVGLVQFMLEFGNRPVPEFSCGSFRTFHLLSNFAKRKLLKVSQHDHPGVIFGQFPQQQMKKLNSFFLKVHWFVESVVHRQDPSATWKNYPPQPSVAPGSHPVFDFGSDGWPAPVRFARWWSATQKIRIWCCQFRFGNGITIASRIDKQSHHIEQAVFFDCLTGVSTLTFEGNATVQGTDYFVDGNPSSD